MGPVVQQWLSACWRHKESRSCSAQGAGCLSSPNVVLKAWKILGEPQVQAGAWYPCRVTTVAAMRVGTLSIGNQDRRGIFSTDLCLGHLLGGQSTPVECLLPPLVKLSWKCPQRPAHRCVCCSFQIHWVDNQDNSAGWSGGSGIRSICSWPEFGS